MIGFLNADKLETGCKLISRISPDLAVKRVHNNQVPLLCAGGFRGSPPPWPESGSEAQKLTRSDREQTLGI